MFCFHFRFNRIRYLFNYLIFVFLGLETTQVFVNFLLVSHNLIKFLRKRFLHNRLPREDFLIEQYFFFFRYDITFLFFIKAIFLFFFNDYTIESFWRTNLIYWFLILRVFFFYFLFIILFSLQYSDEHQVIRCCCTVSKW